MSISFRCEIHTCDDMPNFDKISLRYTRKYVKETCRFNASDHMFISMLIFHALPAMCFLVYESWAM